MFQERPVKKQFKRFTKISRISEVRYELRQPGFLILHVLAYYVKAKTKDNIKLLLQLLGCLCTMLPMVLQKCSVLFVYNSAYYSPILLSYDSTYAYMGLWPF